MATLVVPLKRLKFADPRANLVCPFILEDCKTQHLSGTSVKYILTCGLTPADPKAGRIPTIATRYIGDRGIAVPLNGNELMAKRQYEQTRGLTRNASILYRVCECALVARLVLVMDTRVPNGVMQTHLTVFCLPRNISNSNSVTCNSMQMPIEMERCITQFMLSSIQARHILG